MLTRPTWIDFGDADLRVLRFLWDDARVHNDFTADASSVLTAARTMAVRGRLALLLGLTEWIVWRFDGLHRRREPGQITEAAWCGTVDPRYFKFFELTREDWVGPVDGPLWCAVTFLEDGFRESYAVEADTFRAIGFVYRLAFHIIPDRAPFDRWMSMILDRFTTAYPLKPDDPIADLFDRRIAERLGPLIGREALDPTRPIDVARDRAFLVNVMRQTRAEANPFLATESDLRERRFVGVPYAVR